MVRERHSSNQLLRVLRKWLYMLLVATKEVFELDAVWQRRKHFDADRILVRVATNL
jgi:hypothetical protein